MQRKILSTIHAFISVLFLINGILILEMLNSLEGEGVFMFMLGSNLNLHIHHDELEYFLITFVTISVIYGIGAFLIVNNIEQYTHMMRWIVPLVAIYSSFSQLFGMPIPKNSLIIVFFSIGFMFIVSSVFELKRKIIAKNDE